MSLFPSPIMGATLCLAFSPLSALAQSAAELEAGRTIFNELSVPNCAVCHTLADAGAVGEVGPNLDELKPNVDQVRAAVTSGIGVMPAFGEVLTKAQIDIVSEYVASAAGQSTSADAAMPKVETASSGGSDLAMGDAAKGEKTFRKCKACHTADKGGANRIGPNLYGIVGASVATVEGYKYSDAMMAYGGVWRAERLMAFLMSPKSVVPGTKMGFAGLRKEQEQLDVIAYLISQSDMPLSGN